MSNVRRFIPLLVIAVLGASISATSPTLARGGETEPPTPNIVVILLDDLRWDIPIDVTMPTVQSEIYGKGVGFSNGFVVNALCCPSRASILTGQWSHTTKVYSNGGAFGGFDSFTDTSTLATWLHDGGYRTALIGKYLNQYDEPYVPPGWDRWVAFRRHGFFDYSLQIDQTLATFGTAEEEYSTDVLGAEADAFIRGTDPEQPLFLYFSPYAPHAPATPAPRHAGAFADLPDWRPLSYNERRIRDKPQFLRDRQKIRGEARVRIDQFRRDQYASLLAVDDAVDRILTALEDTGRLQDTAIVFLSDNGILWGEHRWDRKVVTFEESIRIPAAVRYDPVTAQGVTDDHVVLNVDVAPTLAELAGVAAPGAEGASLVPLLQGADPPWRTDFLIEHAVFGILNRKVPAFCAVRDVPRYTYTAYSTGEKELYDLQRDPFAMRNVAGRDRYAAREAALHARTVELCDPLPPGFTLPPEPPP